MPLHKMSRSSKVFNCAKRVLDRVIVSSCVRFAGPRIVGALALDVGAWLEGTPDPGGDADDVTASSTRGASRTPLPRVF